MAVRTHDNITMSVASSNNKFVIIWLDDHANDDPNIKEILSSIFDHVYTSIDPEGCMELIESIQMTSPYLSILISGKYGQRLVPDYLQHSNKVKHIYVFCFDIGRHSQWADTCDKVRCVFSDISKILQCMQYDIQDSIEQQNSNNDDDDDNDKEEEQNEFNQSQQERFINDNNLLDQLALDLLLDSSDDGVEDFTDYIKKYHHVNDQIVDEELHEQYFQPEQTIEEWYQPNSFYTNIHSNDLSKLWLLRWFIRLYHQQLTNKYRKLIENKTKFTVYYGMQLNNNELNRIKHRINEIIIITESLMTYKNRRIAFDSIQNNQSNTYKVLLEININTANHDTIPYGEIKNEQILLWFGGRFRLSKIEYVEEDDSYWIIGLNLCSKLNSNVSIRNLYQYYYQELIKLNNLYHAFGRLFMYKGLYIQAEEWLKKNNHYQELIELAIRRSHYEQAKQYLEYLPNDSYDTDLLNVYLNILISKDHFSKERFILMKIISEATDRFVRARANIALGYIYLINMQQIDQALEYFTIANEVLRKILPDIHPIIANSLIGIGYIHYIQHNIIEARKCFEMALNIQKQSLEYNHPDFAKTHNGLAHCLANNHKTIHKALNEFDDALNILLNTFRYEHQYHPEILATQNDIEQVRKGKKLCLRSTLLDYI